MTLLTLPLVRFGH